jgi:transposase
MGWLRISLTDDEQRVVQQERESHPSACVRRRLLVLWSLHCGLKREQAAQLTGLAVSSVQRIVSLYREGGLDALLQQERGYVPVGELAQHTDVIRQSLEQQPVRTIAEACQRIKDLTGVERRPTQVRQFLKSIGLKWQRVRVIPVPPKKVWLSTWPFRPSFWTRN